MEVRRLNHQARTSPANRNQIKMHPLCIDGAVLIFIFWAMYKSKLHTLYVVLCKALLVQVQGFSESDVNQLSYETWKRFTLLNHVKNCIFTLKSLMIWFTSVRAKFPDFPWPPTKNILFPFSKKNCFLTSPNFPWCWAPWKCLLSTNWNQAIDSFLRSKSFKIMCFTPANATFYRVYPYIPLPCQETIVPWLSSPLH